MVATGTVIHEDASGVVVQAGAVRVALAYPFAYEILEDA